VLTNIYRKSFHVLSSEQAIVGLQVKSKKDGEEVVVMEDEKEVSLKDLTEWQPLKMEVKSTKVVVRWSNFQLNISIDVPMDPTPTIGQYIQGSYIFKTSWEVCMSESRIWQVPRNEEDGVKQFVKSPYHRVEYNPYLLRKNSLRASTTRGLSFVKSENLTLQSEEQHEDLYSEKIYIWRRGFVYEVDSSMNIREIEVKVRDKREGFGNLPNVLVPDMDTKFSHLYLVPDEDTEGKNSGKIVYRKDQVVPLMLTQKFLSGRDKSIGLNLIEIDEIEGDDTVLSYDETLMQNTWNKIDLERSYLIPIFGMSEGWVLDTSDERFLLIPREDTHNSVSLLKRPLLNNTSGKTDADLFTCIRLGSVASSEILENAITGTGLDRLYLPLVQDIKESKTNMKAVKPQSNNDKPYTVSLVSQESSLDFDGPNGLYYREIFFEIPLYLASKLNTSGKYLAAQEWMHRIFNPQKIDPLDKKENVWRYRPFREMNESPPRASILSDMAFDALKENALDPNLIADTRMIAHMKALLFRYIDNLLDWGDNLFAEDTRESINESLIAYLQCQAILGKRPNQIPESGKFKIQVITAKKILSEPNNFTSNFYLPGWKNRPFVRESVTVADDSTLDDFTLDDPLESPALLGRYFCVPENKQLVTYWDRLDDRLDKIRRSLNIKGIFRQLPLFQPPIDPRALIAAGGALGSLTPIPVPHYRFDLMLSTAKEMIVLAIDFGRRLMKAIEREDAKLLAMQEVKMSLTINLFNKRIKNNAISVAEFQTEYLELTKSNLVLKKSYYEGQIDGTGQPSMASDRLNQLSNRLASSTSKTALLALSTATSGISSVGSFAGGAIKDETGRRKEAKGKAKDANKTQINEEDERDKSDKESKKKKGKLKKAGNFLKDKAKADEDGSRTAMGASIVRALPETETGSAGLGPLLALKYGAEAISGALELTGIVLQFKAAADEAKANKEDLEFQKLELKAQNEVALKQVKRDIELLNIQLLESITNEKSAKLELELIEAEEQLLNETNSFLKSRFTSAELYQWLSKKLIRLLKNVYNNAFEAAKMAERCLQFEANTDEKFVTRNWLDEKNGLLAAEMLMADVNQMSLFRLKNDYRYQEIERKISLRDEIFELESNESLESRLEEDTKLNFELSEELFDMDFPGHYFRIIKTVSLSIVPAPSLDVDALKKKSPRLTLTQIGNRVVTRPDIAAVTYLLGGNSDSEVDPNVLRLDWRAQQSMTVSRWEDDNGMFVTNWVHDNRYFPFEGTGAVSSWSLELGQSTSDNQVNMIELLESRDTDILMTVKYTADMDSGKFRDEVTKLISKD